MDWLHLIIDFVLHIDVHLQELFTTYGIWVYGILFLIIFSETARMPWIFMCWWRY
jgi:membrane-associated protein